ncbi:hypothetical protein A3D85_02475 [Candidatus Amesbacteria bacterium RIFCSPHIGHO2_02_FULL_47_9]|uniref:Uncharacterized protein n=1 Tax=Candidatus Amesbacteria bacterium RIFCSPHIGHO2_01_FULL_48_32b TaxID=1797253 RepID=A0A1F4YFD2_9BACT|nr:MAG: hypothetical protein A2876_03350 [Candidatus Amesbacteria bacterium RIFCSPHIGHO2_01_FULL_48_32b]OGD02331.1 MAG: hypothetical protein A3D85_02475 [Candidatus Amesbacteria bacterium RIFCSPHIGHO2_02_FULL_47_9]OGD08488.1 MAG: hypothetical protein A2899_01690 [Candidatus Amesbacteria bacterium RIFCSPLOWO2_01_FULL_49_25]
MIDSPVLEFGVGPRSFEEGLLRLPNRTHPLYKTDAEIEELAHLKETLDRILENGCAGLLPRRMVPLSQADMDLMEKWSFRRLRAYEVQWATIGPENQWASVFGRGDIYWYWKICRLYPGLPANSGLELVCVETCDVSSLKPKIGPEFKVGIVTHGEIIDLLRDLGVQNAHF